uniref:Uncharacterized protein n=1 Tax=Aegilops tauschii TaxID=37682 RepID=M8BS25_AEGTA
MVQLRSSLSMTRARARGDSDDADDRGWNQLHVAARKGNLKEVYAAPSISLFFPLTINFLAATKLLSQLGTFRQGSCRCSNFASSPAKMSWNLEHVRRLLNEGMDVNAPAWGPKSPGATPLHLAAQGGHVKIMDELLERGANIDARTKGACGWTPLHIAAKERNKRVVRFLVENGEFLPPDLNDHRFNPPLHYCSGLEWAYEMKRMQDESDSGGEASFSSSN